MSADTPDAEGTASTVAGETVTVLSIPIAPDETLAAGVRWYGFDAAGNVVMHETTFVLKRVGATPSVEVGGHDNGTIRNEIEIAGAASDYVPTATGVDLTVTGAVGTPIDWTVQAWFSSFPL